jgi:hypothetical protein
MYGAAVLSSVLFGHRDRYRTCWRCSIGRLQSAASETAAAAIAAQQVQIVRLQKLSL